LDPQCSACETGHYLSQGALGAADTCPACTSVPFCSSALTCTTASDSVCTECQQPGYYLDAGTCKACAPVVNCAVPSVQSCTSATTSQCETCADGYWLDGSTSTFDMCRQCTSVSHCSSELTCHNASDSQCSTCQDGYYLVDGTDGAPDHCEPCAAVPGCTGSVMCTNAGDSQCECADPVLEHFNCYEAVDLKNPQFVAETGISVVDDFGSSTATATKPAFFCAAAGLNGADAVDPSASLCCYTRNALTLPAAKKVQTSDDFGTLQVQVKKTDLLCQSCAAIDPEPVCTALDVRFQCYESTDLKSPKFTPRTATIEDRFQTSPVSVSKPALFCSATNQGVSVVPSADLCCYQAPAPAFVTPLTVPIVDAFGSLELQIKKSTMICEPCSSTLLP
jgi:hypothetical protein